MCNDYHSTNFISQAKSKTKQQPKNIKKVEPEREVKSPYFKKTIKKEEAKITNKSKNKNIEKGRGTVAQTSKNPFKHNSKTRKDETTSVSKRNIRRSSTKKIEYNEEKLSQRVTESENEFEDTKKKPGRQKKSNRNSFPNAKPGTSQENDLEYEPPKKAPPRRLSKTSVSPGIA